jgi:hypothetical protein
MRKFLPILTLALASFFVYSCDNNDDDVIQVEDNDTYSVAYDINNPVFSRVNDNLYTYGNDFNNPLIESDVVLIYMQVGTDGGSPLWRLLPYTYYVGNANNDAVDYVFDFSKFGININVNASFALTGANSSYYTGKRFRVVVIPAATGPSSKGAVDYSDYNEVVKLYGIDESKIKVKN